MPPQLDSQITSFDLYGAKSDGSDKVGICDGDYTDAQQSPGVEMSIVQNHRYNQ